MGSGRGGEGGSRRHQRAESHPGGTQFAPCRRLLPRTDAAEGEVLQLTAAQDLKTSEDTYLKVVRGKTAALFSAATEVGAVIAGVPEDQVRALWTYGDALGIAFQIVDDLLDYGGTDAVIGKNILRSAADLLAQLPSTFNAVKAVSPQSTNARPWASSRLGNQPIMLA